MEQYHPLTELNLKEGDRVFFLGYGCGEVECNIVNLRGVLIAVGASITQSVNTSTRWAWRRAERQPVKMEDFL